MNSLLVGVYKFWRSQAPFDKSAAAVDSRMLPSVIAASDERANVGMWATTFFCTILSCNLLGLVPFNEAPTSGLGFATGLGISTWATATALGFYKLGFSFPGHFIPGEQRVLTLPFADTKRACNRSANWSGVWLLYGAGEPSFGTLSQARAHLPCTNHASN